MPERDTNTDHQSYIEQCEEEERMAARAEAIKAGCLTRDIANDWDGGKSALGRATVEALEKYAFERSQLPRR